jgi:cytoskeletal protein CcmA (bactofilin family)
VVKRNAAGATRIVHTPGQGARMEIAARIGPSIRIKGDVHSGEPLVIAGKVDGNIEVSGHSLTIEPGGSVEATVSAHTIVVSGSANGILTASAKVIIKDSAKIDGDISAPSVTLAEGAIFNGRIETVRKKALPLAS